MKAYEVQNEWKIDSIVDDKTNLTITWSATYNTVAVNPCNATLGAGAPGRRSSGFP